MHVSQTSMILMSTNIGLGILIPTALFIFFNRKYGARFKTFLAGMLGMLFFALVFEQLFHAAILSSPLGEIIQGNLWIYAIYGGLAAGVFEETGRLFIMRFLMKRDQNYDANALMYGAGHGGFEAMYILVIGMVNNLLYSVMINSGDMEQILESMDGEALASMQASIASLCSASPASFLLSPIERCGALAAQIALSVLVWFAVTRIKDKKLFPLAIFLHAFLDASTVILINLDVPAAIVEVIVWIIAAGYVILARKLWMERVSAEQLEEQKIKLQKDTLSPSRRYTAPKNLAARANLNKRKH